jgi:hypothetical protein
MLLRKLMRARHGALAKGVQKAGAGAARKGVRIRITRRAGSAGGRGSRAALAKGVQRAVGAIIKLQRRQRQKRS